MVLYQKGADETAFDELYSRYSGKLWGYLLRRINNTAAAEDILQTVFLTLHKNKEKFDPKHPFSNWIFTLCRNVMIDAIRKNKNKEITVDLDQIPAPTTEAPHTRLPDEVIQQLPHTQKTAVQLRYLSGLSFESIAGKMHTTAQNARQLSSRGIKKLRKILKGS